LQRQIEEERVRKHLRRSATAVALSVVAVGGGAVVAGATDTPDENGGGDEGRAKNIILLIGDGMGTTHVAL